MQQGKLCWAFQDDNNVRKTFIIPNSYYIPEGKVQLLLPQHWSKSMKDHKIRQNMPAGETTTHDKSVLFWNNQKNTLTVPIDKRTNVATF